MRIEIKVHGVEEFRRQLKDFSERRMRSAVATGLTRSAKRLAGDWQDQIDRQIDRPVARTRSATRFVGASATKLQATVMVKDKMAGLAPSDYLAPHEIAGSRLLKKFERALIASGAMPQGYFTVPGKHAARDGYGNVTRSLIIAVISQLGRDFSPGYQQVISKNEGRRLASQARHGRRYIVVKVGTPRVSPGIYERMKDRSLKAVFLFRRTLQYDKRLSLVDRAKQDGGRILSEEVSWAVADSLARLNRSSGGKA